MSIACSCDKCKSACRHKPGWFLPEEIERAANYLGISVQKLFGDYLGVDWWEGADPIFVLAPATQSMDPGTTYPYVPAGKCIFLDKNELCIIHEVKPHECREHDHMEKHSNATKRHREVAEAWEKEEHQELITKLLGHQPTAATGSILDLL